MEQVIAPHPEPLAQAFEEPAAAHVDHARRAMHWRRQYRQPTAVEPDDSLQPEAHPEQRNTGPEGRVDRPAHAEILRTPGTGREHYKIRPLLGDALARKARAVRRHLGAGAPEVARQRVHERILVVDHDHSLPHAGSIRTYLDLRTGSAVATPNRVEHGRRLQPRFRLLVVGIRAVYQRRSGTHLGDAVLDPHGAQRQPRVDVAVEPEEADRAPVPAPRRALVVLDELDRAPLRCPGDGDRPCVGEEAVERVMAFAQPPLDMADGVDHPRVHLNLAMPDHPHAIRFAHPGLVGAVDVHAHGELGLRLLRAQQRPDPACILDRVVAARDSPRDGTALDAPALDPHEHFRRRGDQVLLLTEVHQRAVGGGVAFPEPPVDFGGRRGTRLEERLARHDPEEIAAAERLDRVPHGRCILPRSVIALSLDRTGRHVRGSIAGTLKSVRALAVHLELVSISGREPTPVVDDQKVVGQEEHKVALAFVA